MRLTPSCTIARDVLGRSAVKLKSAARRGADDPRTSCRFDDAEFRLKFGFNFRGLLVDESQLPAAVLSEIAFTVRSLAFTD